jgi:biopolymer transport protein ExbD
MAAMTSVNLIPMIDVVLNLVFFFMVTTTFVVAPGIALELPTSSTSEPVAVGKLVIAVVSEDEIYLNAERHTLESLQDELAAYSAEEREKTKSVVVEGDRTVSYSLLVSMLDILRQNGFRGVNLRTREATLGRQPGALAPDQATTLGRQPGALAPNQATTLGRQPGALAPDQATTP